jgi:hypothetical protein
MSLPAQNLFNQQDDQLQGMLDVEAHGNNLGIELAEQSPELLENKTLISNWISAKQEFADLTEQELKELTEAATRKAEAIINLTKKVDAANNDESKISKFEKERFVRTINTNTPHVANDNSSTWHKVKKTLGLVEEVETKKTPAYPGIYSEKAANDVDEFKSKDSIKDDLYFQARTIARLEGELKELLSEMKMSEKGIDLIGADFNRLAVSVKKVDGIIQDYQKILDSYYANNNINAQPQLAAFALKVDNWWYKPASDEKYKNAFILQAELEEDLLKFEEKLRNQLEAEQTNEIAELEKESPAEGIELLSFQKRQTRIRELLAGIEELVKSHANNLKRTSTAKKSHSNEEISRLKKEKSQIEKRAEKWEDIRDTEINRVFWYEFGNQVIAIKQHKANLARIGAKGRNVYEKHLDGIMREYLDLRNEVQAFEAAMGIRGFINVLDKEFGVLKPTAPALKTLMEAKEQLKRAKTLMKPRSNHLAPPMPPVMPPEEDPEPISGERLKADLDGVQDLDLDVPTAGKTDDSKLDEDSIGEADALADVQTTDIGNDNSEEKPDLPPVTIEQLKEIADKKLSNEEEYRADIKDRVEAVREYMDEFGQELQAKLKKITEVQSDLKEMVDKKEITEELANRQLMKLEAELGQPTMIYQSVIEIKSANEAPEINKEIVLLAKKAFVNFQLPILMALIDETDIDDSGLIKMADELTVIAGNPLSEPSKDQAFPVMISGFYLKDKTYHIEQNADGSVNLVEADTKTRISNSLERSILEEQKKQREAAVEAEKLRQEEEQIKLEKLAQEQILAEQTRKQEEILAAATRTKINETVETKEVLIPSEILSVGDLHGNYRVFEDTLVQVLKVAEKGDDGQLKWIGGNRKLNFLGDILVDRSPEGLEILWAIRNLRKQAESDGGKIEIVAGNHEDFGIGFLMGGADMIENYGHALRADSTGNWQGRGIIELFARYTAMGRHHSQFSAMNRAAGKTIPENEATLEEKLIDLRNMRIDQKTTELDAFRKEILETMRNDQKGYQLLEEWANMNLVLFDGGNISIHTEPTNEILREISGNASNAEELRNNVYLLNEKFKWLLHKLLLNKSGLDAKEEEELRRLRRIFLYTDSRDFKPKYEMGEIAPVPLQRLADAGGNRIIHGHTDLNHAISFKTDEGVEILNIDRSVGKTPGTTVGIESSTAVIYRDKTVETGLPEYKKLEKFDYAAKEVGIWLEEVFATSSETEVDEQKDKLAELIGSKYPEEIRARLQIDQLKYLIGTFAIANKLDEKQKLPLKAENIKELIDLYHEWIADEVRAGVEIKKIVQEMVEMNVSIQDLAKSWRAKKVLKSADQEKRGEDADKIEDANIQSSEALSDDLIIEFSPQVKNPKDFNKLSEEEHDSDNHQAFTILSTISTLNEMQLAQIGERLSQMSPSQQSRIAYNIVNYQETVKVLLTGKIGDRQLFGKLRYLPRVPVLFKVKDGLDVSILEFLIDTKKVEKASRALSELNGKSIKEIKEQLKKFKNKSVKDWFLSLK